MPKSRALSFAQRSCTVAQVRSRVKLPRGELARPSAAEGACLFRLGRALELLPLRVELRMYRMELFRPASSSGARLLCCGELAPFALSCVYLVLLSEGVPLCRLLGAASPSDGRSMALCAGAATSRRASSRQGRARRGRAAARRGIWRRQPRHSVAKQAGALRGTGRGGGGQWFSRRDATAGQ